MLCWNECGAGFLIVTVTGFVAEGHVVSFWFCGGGRLLLVGSLCVAVGE